MNVSVSFPVAEYAFDDVQSQSSVAKCHRCIWLEIDCSGDDAAALCDS